MERIFYGLAVLLVGLLGLGGPISAGEPGQPRDDCPDLYRTWDATHAMGRFEWEEIAYMFTIKVEKERAIMTWGDGKKIVFKRGDKHLKQTYRLFVGRSKDKSKIEIAVDNKYRADRPDDKCRAHIFYEKVNGVDIQYLTINLD